MELNLTRSVHVEPVGQGTTPTDVCPFSVDTPSRDGPTGRIRAETMIGASDGVDVTRPPLHLSVGCHVPEPGTDRLAA